MLFNAKFEINWILEKINLGQILNYVLNWSQGSRLSYPRD